MKKLKPYPELHAKGTILLENAEVIFGEDLHESRLNGDIGIQIAADGRLWLCVNGIAFIRFSPHPDGKMSKVNG